MSNHTQYPPDSEEAILDYANALLEIGPRAQDAVLDASNVTIEEIARLFGPTPTVTLIEAARKVPNAYVMAQHYVNMNFDEMYQERDLTIDHSDQVIGFDVHHYSINNDISGRHYLDSSGPQLVIRDSFTRRPLFTFCLHNGILSVQRERAMQYSKLTLNLTAYVIANSHGPKTVDHRLEDTMANVPRNTDEMLEEIIESVSDSAPPEYRQIDTNFFIRQFDIGPVQLWHRLKATGYDFELREVPFELNLDDKRPKVPLVSMSRSIVIGVRLTKDSILLEGRRTVTLKLDGDSHEKNVMLLVDSDVSDGRPVATIGHDTSDLELTVDYPEITAAGWKATATGYVTVITPKTKEHASTMSTKPESSKKPSISKRESLDTATSPWVSLPPALMVGDRKIVVDVTGRTDEEIGKLRREWFWMDARKSVKPASYLTLEQALGNQYDLIEAAKAFIGIRAYHAKSEKHEYTLVIRRDDDISLLCLLDRDVWKSADTVYPSVIEDYHYDLDNTGYVVIDSLRDALLLQNHISIERKQKEQHAFLPGNRPGPNAPKATAKKPGPKPGTRKTPAAKKPAARKTTTKKA